MNRQTHELGETELRVRRESLRQGLNRANAATVAMVLLALGLAITAILLALRSQRDRAQAEAARVSAEGLLYESSLAPIRAQRLSGRMGQRLRGLEAVEVAARIQASDELREQAISTLALTDLEDSGLWRTLPTNTIHAVMDPSQKYFAYVIDPQTIVACRWEDGVELFRIRHSEPGSPWYSPNSRYIYSRDLGLTVWNAKNGQPVFEWKVKGQEDRVLDASISDETGILAMTDAQGVLRLYDFAAEKIILEKRTFPSPYMVRFDPAGRRLFVECQGYLAIWDWRSDSVQRQFKNEAWLGDVRWTPDGNAVVIGLLNSSIKFWDLQRDWVGTLEGHTREIVAAIPHPTAPYLASFSWDNTIRFWDLSAGQPLLQASGMMPVGFSPDGNTFAVWKLGKGLGKLKFHASDIYRSLGITPGAPAAFADVEFSPDGSLIVGANNDGVCVWETATGRRRGYAQVERAAMAWFEDDNTVLVVKAKGFERRSVPKQLADSALPLAGEVLVDSRFDVGSSGYHRPSGRVVSALRRRSQAIVFDSHTGKVLADLRGQFALSDPVFSPDGRWIASGCWHPTVTMPLTVAVWDAQTGQMITNFPTTKASVTFSPDSQRLILGGVSKYTVIETDSWKAIRQFDRNETMIDNGKTAFSSEPNVAAIHATDRILRLVDVNRGAELARLAAPEKRILGRLAFSEDGRYVAAASDANVQLWDLQNLKRHLGTMGLNWEEKPITRRTAPLRIENSIRIVVPTVYGAIVLTVGLALLLLRHQRRALARYQEVDAAIAKRNEELAATQEELLHSQKMRALGTLAAGIAHDFNNLLSVIRISNTLIGRKAKNDELIRENSAEIEQAVQQGKNVVQAMLGYSREDAPAQEPFVLAELVEDVVALLSKQFLTGITLTLDLDRSAPLVALPRARIEQLLLNLVVNSSEAMQGHGRLSLVVRSAHRTGLPRILEPVKAPAYAELIVVDSGPGIPAEIMPRIFEPFFTTKTVGASRGTGLGLSMVYTIARDCGLGIEVESERGRGARFIVLFPAHASGRDSHIPAEPPGRLTSSE